MLNEENTQAQIAVRLYDNKTYGTTYAKGKFRRNFYNGTIEVKHASYLVDFNNYEDWANTAQTNEQMADLASALVDSNFLYSWIRHYDRSTKNKTPVSGFCVVDMESLTLAVVIRDSSHRVDDLWELQAKPCRDGKKGAPQLLATNADLSSW